MTHLWYEIIASVLSVPQALNSARQFLEWLDPKADHTEFDRLEQMCTAGEERAKADIQLGSQRAHTLQNYANFKKLLAEARKKQLPISGLFEELLDNIEHGHASAATTPRPSTTQIDDIKKKLRNDLPLQSAYNNICCSASTPPDIDMHDNRFVRLFSNLDGELCFKEYFNFTTERAKTKSRICWMMLLLRELKCPRLVELVRVFIVSEGPKPGFYTFTRVPEAGPSSLYTLAERASTVRSKKQVLLHLSEAVEEIHAHSIVHKNICAYNVVLDADDNAWLAGFSSSRLADQSSYRIPSEDEKRMVMVYCDSPEPSKHLRSFKSDIYALGVTMLEVAVGKSFVQDEDFIREKCDIFKLLNDHCKPGELQDLIHECIAQEARSRPQASYIKNKLEFMNALDIDEFFQVTIITAL